MCSALSLSNAVQVDIYPQPEHQHHVKYVQPAHVAPVKYIQQPQHVKYIEKPHYEKHIEYDEPAQYEYGYEVHDEHTGDHKMHTEKRDGDTVHGRYEVLDPDGFKRIVEYTADAHHGFNAVVRREPTNVKVPVKVIQKVIEPQPVKYYSQPQPAPFVVSKPKYYDSQPKYYDSQPKYYDSQPKYYEPQPKYYEPPHVHQKVIIPQPVQQKVVIPQPTPQYYAAPERPKYYREPTVVKQVYSQPQPTVKYVTPAPHYPHHQY